MRAHHTPHALPAFPVYSASFVANDRLVLGGGGGTGRSGIKNKLRLYATPDDATLTLLDEYELENDEDAPMSMAADAKLQSSHLACGINSSTEQMEKGKNENCRVFSVKSDRLNPAGSTNTLRVAPDNLEDYQKVTALSPDHTLLAAAGKRDFAVLTYPSLITAAATLHTEHDIYDANFSSSSLVVTTTDNLLVYAVPSTSAPIIPNGTESKDLKLIKTVERPALPGGEANCTFRAARFLPGSDKTIYTVLNTTPPRTRGKSTPKRGYVCKWDAETWEVQKIRKVGERGITCFDISPNGKLLAFGSADYTVGLLDAQTLGPLLTILKAHEFPPTTLRFNPASTLMVSGSADNSVRLVTVPASNNGSSWSTLTVILLTLITLLLAIFAANFINSGTNVW